MMTILLYGFLGKKYGKVHRYDVKSAAEAARALSATIKGFKQTFIDGGYYKVIKAGKEELSLEDTLNPQSTRETIRIVPVVAGAGKGFGKIILGAALMVAGYYAYPFLGVTGLASPGVAQMIGSAITNIGFSLVLGGVAQMLYTTPKVTSTEATNNAPSFAFNGVINTTAQGNAVPLCYGRMIVGSQVISAGLVAEQI